MVFRELLSDQQVLEKGDEASRSKAIALAKTLWSGDQRLAARKQFDIRSSVDRYRYVAFGVNRHGQDLIAIPATKRTVKLVNLDNGAEQILKGPTTQIYGVAFSPDFQRIVSYGNDIFVWNTTTGETELGIEENTGATLQAAFSPDGTSILTRGFKGNVGLWDVQSGREKMRLLEEFEQTTHSVAFSPDGNRIIAVVNDNALMVWSAHSKH